MTGFGRALVSKDSKDILVEIRSVNHRYYEFNARVPRAYSYIEPKLKELLNGSIARGKVEVSVSVYHTEGADVNVKVNESVAKAYIDALRGSKDMFSLEDNIRLTDLMRIPDVFVVSKEMEDEDEVWEEIKEVTEIALDNFLKMRQVEGETIKNNILTKLDAIEETVYEIEKREPQLVEEYRTRLYEKLKEVLGKTEIDESRILTEAAIFADKTAVDEEMVRLHSHLAQFRNKLNSDKPVGRELDFLMQEMNREANTTGSKISDIAVTNLVVSIKSELEKVREQIQNIE